MASLDGARFVWREARCVDGALPLAHLGFERELTTEVRGRRVLMVFDTTLARDGCREVLAWEAMFARDVGHWDFWSPTRLVSPVGATCGVTDLGEHGGTLELDGDELRVTSYQSPWCRGFDVRFDYQRVPAVARDERAQLERYVLHYNRRDLRGLAELFSVQATLLEPFSKTDDGTVRRHAGKAAVLAWHRQAFAGSNWSALRLRDLHKAGDDATWVADWDYMDSELAEPFRGRSLFIMADGEIFLMELQLTTPPRAALIAPTTAPLGADVEAETEDNNADNNGDADMPEPRSQLSPPGPA